MVLTSYWYIGLLFVIAILFGVIALVAASVVSYLTRKPKPPDPVKLDVYECGVDTIGPTWVQFRVGFYLYALIFVIFDVETVFLYPWAVAVGKLGLFALIEMFLFVAILVLGLAYAWRKGALEWK